MPTNQIPLDLACKKLPTFLCFPRKASSTMGFQHHFLTRTATAISVLITGDSDTSVGSTFTVNHQLKQLPQPIPCTSPDSDGFYLVTCSTLPKAKPVATPPLPPQHPQAPLPMATLRIAKAYTTHLRYGLNQN